MVGITMHVVFPTEVFPRWETLGGKYFSTGYSHHGNSH